LDLLTPSRRVYTHEGIPFVEFTLTQKGLDDTLHKRILHYYKACLEHLEKLCEQILLPQRVAAYESNSDPRKRFYISRTRISLTLIAEVKSPYIYITRRVHLQEGQKTQDRTILEIFGEKDGRLIPQKKEKKKHDGRTNGKNARGISISRKPRPSRRAKNLP
jgi:hypothetical protein